MTIWAVWCQVLTVCSDYGASKDFLSICIVALRRGIVESEVLQSQDCVCVVDSIWQAFIDTSAVESPEDFTTETWSLAH